MEKDSNLPNISMKYNCDICGQELIKDAIYHFRCPKLAKFSFDVKDLEYKLNSEFYLHLYDNQQYLKIYHFNDYRIEKRHEVIKLGNQSKTCIYQFSEDSAYYKHVMSIPYSIPFTTPEEFLKKLQLYALLS